MNDKTLELIEKMEQGFREDVPQDSKRRILENSFKVFIKRGLAGTRISDIAKLAGFSQGFVYNHFKSKDDIFTEITRLASMGSLRIIKTVFVMERSPYQKIKLLAKALTKPNSLAQMHMKLILLHTVSTDIIPLEAKEIQAETAKAQIVQIAEMIKYGQEIGEIRDGDPIEIAIEYFSVIQGIAIMQSQAEGKITIDVENILGFLKK